MKKQLIVLVSVFILSFGLISTTAFAAQAPSTVLPGTDIGARDCDRLMNWVDINESEAREIIGQRNDLPGDATGAGADSTYTDILACGIRSGNISLWMIPFYIRYILEFVIGLAGLVTLGFIIYGGVVYMFAGISEDKEGGKKAIKNGIIGLVLTLTAWAIVNIVIALLT